MVPRARLFIETLVVAEGSGLTPELRVRELPAVSLSFDYEGTRIRASDPRRQFFVGHKGTVEAVARDAEAEARACRVLESFGAVDLRFTPDHEPDPDSEADYLLPSQAGVHGYCSFAALAIPELRALGWEVSVDPSFPYVASEVRDFCATVHPCAEKNGWFSLELGIEVDGHKVDLLPILLAWLDRSGDGDLLAIAHVPARFRAVALDGGQYVLVPAERLRAILEVLVEVYQGRIGRRDVPMAFPGVRAASLAKLDRVFEKGGLAWAGAEAILHRGRSLARGPAETAFAPAPGLCATLRPYQERGVLWLEHLRANGAAGVLADDMGLGKTLQTIAQLAGEKVAGRMDAPSLVVVPTSLVGNWRRELGRFAPGLTVAVLHGPKRRKTRRRALETDVVITTYPVLVRDLAFFEEQLWHYVVLDEAQAIKNKSSLAHKAVLALDARHRLCLTGTPIENNLEELRAIFAFLVPDLLGDREPFQSKFGRPIELGGDAEALRVLRDTVAPFLLRRMKEQVAPELPPKTELLCHVELRGAQRELYESIRLAAHADVRKAIREKGLGGSAIAVLDALMKLRQVCCDPRLVDVPSAALVRESAKYERLMDLLPAELARGRRVLVFSQFAMMLALVSAGLTERGIVHVTLTGSTPDRQKPIDAFVRGDADVFLISLKAGGIGLNLTGADTVIHYDPWWNPASHEQATDRAHRIGQTHPVFVHSLVVAGSVEERMLRLQQRKRFLAETILGQSVGPVTGVTPRDIEALFAPLSS